MSDPSVTVFIAVHNRARYVGDAIASVLGQDFTDFELLLIDDGSSDDSIAVIERFADPRIRLVRNDGNRGIPFTRSRGLELARGRYLAVLDSDDIMAPKRLVRQVAFLDRNPHIAIVGGWSREMDDGGRLKSGIKMLPLVPAELHARLLFRTCHHHASVMGRTAILRDYRYRADFPVSSDFDLFTRVTERHRLANLPRVLLHRRIHAGRVTREHADLVKAMNMAVTGRQLDALGLDYTPEELELHFLIPRIRKGTAVDRALLERISAWLERIPAADRDARIYDARALRAVAGQFWLLACLRAAGTIGARSALSAFLASPLRTAARLGLRAPR
jgi:glycosyltransferase involved in cell wall biosynthesis